MHHSIFYHFSLILVMHFYSVVYLNTSYNLFQLAFIRKIAKRRSNISLYGDELGRGFVGELDYNIEAANATKFMVIFFLVS